MDPPADEQNVDIYWKLLPFKSTHEIAASMVDLTD